MWSGWLDKHLLNDNARLRKALAREKTAKRNAEHDRDANARRLREIDDEKQTITDELVLQRRREKDLQLSYDTQIAELESQVQVHKATIEDMQAALNMLRSEMEKITRSNILRAETAATQRAV